MNENFLIVFVVRWQKSDPMRGDMNECNPGAASSPASDHNCVYFLGPTLFALVYENREKQKMSISGAGSSSSSGVKRWKRDSSVPAGPTNNIILAANCGRVQGARRASQQNKKNQS
jgi:hypothetical protein